MSKLQHYQALLAFIASENLSEDSLNRLFDEARAELSISEMDQLYNSTGDMPSGFYTRLSQYDGEMGGLSRW